MWIYRLRALIWTEDDHCWETPPNPDAEGCKGGGRP